ncbi:MAG: type I glutamate--ammonia ligase [Eubacteriaceae bacterium]|nr:type I glutamate--ammonia ligase [Eubacteriaceae bacterium]MDD4508217.1 type I glutamate--ammonia ligase [Eubacteriaceae bacterium]
MHIGKSTLDITTFVEENDIKFLRMQFCGVDGTSRNVAISNNRVEDAIFYGIPFDGDSVIGFGGRDHSDLLLKPDFSTIVVLPWRPQRGKVARVLCDVTYPDGRRCEMDTRNVLKQTVKKAEDLGYTLNVGSECEFFLFNLGEDGNPTFSPGDQAGYCSVAPRDKGENTRRDIILTLEDMGFAIESSHHESGQGQHEIDFRYSDALDAADRFITLRNVVRTIAQRNGQHATFMPKPINGQPGSGMHINLSLIKKGVNLFASEKGGLSEDAKHFAAGILAHIKAITAVANPTVNSYKRLAAGMEAPQKICWGYSSRDALIRIPAAPGQFSRLELRSPDPACNPYLTYALVLAAGLEGIEQQIPLMPALPDNKTPLESLPATLREALDEMAADPLVTEVLGAELTEKYIDLKSKEWQQYTETVHDWETAHYFCLY